MSLFTPATALLYKKTEQSDEIKARSLDEPPESLKEDKKKVVLRR